MTSSIFDVDWDTGEIRLRYGDLFAGAGGFTSGVEIALARMGLRGDAVVVNRDPVAVASHKQNHQNARHYCIDLDAAVWSSSSPSAIGDGSPSSVGGPMAPGTKSPVDLSDGIGEPTDRRHGVCDRLALPESANNGID